MYVSNPCPPATSHISTSCAMQSSADVSMHSTAKVDRVWCHADCALGHEWLAAAWQPPFCAQAHSAAPVSCSSMMAYQQPALLMGMFMYLIVQFQAFSLTLIGCLVAALQGVGAVEGLV